MYKCWIDILFLFFVWLKKLKFSLFVGYLSASECIVCGGSCVVKSISVWLYCIVDVVGFLVVLVVVDAVVVSMGSVNCVVWFIGAFETDTRAGRIGARIVDDRAYGRSDIKSKSYSSSYCSSLWFVYMFGLEISGINSFRFD